MDSFSVHCSFVPKREDREKKGSSFVVSFLVLHPSTFFFSLDREGLLIFPTKKTKIKITLQR